MSDNANKIYCVFDRTDRNRASTKPVAIAMSVEAAQREVDRLRSTLPEYAHKLVYFNDDVPVVS